MGGGGFACRDLEDVKDQVRLIRHVDLPILVGSQKSGVVSHKLAYERG